ncbi:hypothetical protein [Capnocytophaga gingivalis]
MDLTILVSYPYAGDKWSNRYYQMPQDLISLISFCKANELTAALITTKDTIGTKTLDELQFTFIPSALYAYNIGANTLKILQ